MCIPVEFCTFDFRTLTSEWWFLSPGMLAHTAVDGTAFFRSSIQPHDVPYPYIQLHTLSSMLTNLPTEAKNEDMRQKLGIDSEVMWRTGTAIVRYANSFSVFHPVYALKVKCENHCEFSEFCQMTVHLL